MKTFLIIAISLMFGSKSEFEIKPGISHETAIEELGKPLFEYDKTVTQSVFTVNFKVTGWKKDGVWYGVQATNNTIQAVYVFKTKKEYMDFVTPPKD